MLPFYQVDIASEIWQFNGYSAELIRSLATLFRDDYYVGASGKESKKISLIGLCAKVEQLFEAAQKSDVIPQ